MDIRLKSFSVLLVLLFTSYLCSAQDAVIADVKTSMRSGTAKGMVKHFDEVVDINIDGEKTACSKNQAEFILRDFYKKYPPVDFQFIHQGSSKEGLKYAIGKYTYGNGSFRVFVKIKQFNANFLIDTIDFSKE